MTLAANVFAPLNTLRDTLKTLHAQDDAAATAIADAITAFDGYVAEAAPLVASAKSISQAQWAAAKQAFIPASQAILIRLVTDALPSTRRDVPSCVAALIAQMAADVDSIQRPVVSVTPSAGGSNSGNGTVLATILGHDGVQRSNVFAEAGKLTCVQDSQTGGAVAGAEQFGYVGAPAIADLFDSAWPGGSGSAVQMTSVNSLTTGINLLTNSSWESFTSPTWANWSVGTGAVGTHLASNTSQYYRGSKSILFTGDGSTLPSLTQDFGSSAGTPSNLSPLTSYGVALRLRTDSAPATGVLRVELVDGSNTVTTDAAGTNNRMSVTCSTLTTDWSTSSAVFRAPRVLPATLRLRVYFSTALENAKTVYIDDLCLVPMTQLYIGGPLVAVFSGSSKWIKDDMHTITVANNHATRDYAATLQMFADRVFNMRASGLQFPDALSPTIEDSNL